MKAFLTGATGFVGSHVARALRRRGHEVHALLRPDSDLARIRDIADSIGPVTGDLASPDLSERLLALQPDVCLHLAWYTVPGKYLDAPENLLHVELGLRLVRLLARAGCRRFVGVGSCSEYAFGNTPRAEDSPTQPRRLYSAAKLALAQILPYVTASTGMSTAWARLFYLYGPFENEKRLVPQVILSLLAGEPAQLTSGEQVRDYLHVEDVAGALVAIAESRLDGIVNVGSGEPTRVRDVVEAIGAILGGGERLRFGALPAKAGDPLYVCADNRRLRRELGFRPKFDLVEGLRHTVEWWHGRARSTQRPGMSRA